MPKAQRRGQKQEEVVAIDVGTRMTKAVHIRRKGSEYVLVNYALVETPVAEKGLAPETLAELFRKVAQSLGTNCRRVALTAGPSGVVLTHAELAPMPSSDLRKMVKLSPKTYLQQDLPDFLFDCFLRQVPGQSDTTTLLKKKKIRTLVGGVRRRVVEDLLEAARQAGLAVESISVGPVGLTNAYRMLREDSHPEAVALLDIGASNSTINLVYQGELVLTRVVNLGADKFADLLSPAPKAEAAPQGEEDISPEVMQARLQRAIQSFAREVDASVGFFSSQHEKPVTQLMISGGAARSQFVVQAIESELPLSCETWNPASGLVIGLPDQRATELEYDAPQLAVAIGTGLGVLRPDSVRINFLAEEQEQEELRRQDPVRRGYYVAGAAVLAMLLWAGWIGWENVKVKGATRKIDTQLQALEASSNQSLRDARRAAELQTVLDGLLRQGADRFLFAPLLDALQHTTVEGIQFQRVSVDRSILQEEPPKPPPGTPKPKAGTKGAEKKQPIIKERVVVSIMGRNYLDSRNINKLIDVMSQHAFFAGKLRAQQPILLKSLQSRQVDPLDANRTFEFFVIECYWADRELKP